MRFSDAPWDGSKSNYDSVEDLLKAIPRAMAAWARAHAKSQGREVTKADAHLPIRNKDGSISVPALRNALARLSSVQGPPPEVKAAAKDELEKLLNAYNKAHGKEACDFRLLGNVLGRAVVPIHESCMLEAIPDTSIGHDSKTGAKARVRIIKAGTSKNRNVWKQEVLTKAAPKFEGARVCMDHKFPDERSFFDTVGEITNVVPDGDGLVGTLEVLESGEKAQMVRGVLREKPRLLGLSIYVYAMSEPNTEGEEVIEEVEDVVSVDVVDRPSAGGGVLAVTECVVEGYDNWKEQPVDPVKEQTETKPAEAPATPPPAAAPAVATPAPAPAPVQTAAEKALAEKDVQIDVLKAELEKQSALVKTLTEEKTKMEQAALIAAFVAEKKMPAYIESAVLNEAKAQASITREGLDALLTKWTAFAEAVRKDAPAAAPAARAEDLTGGLPPRTEAAKPAPAAAPAAPAKSDDLDFLVKIIDQRMGNLRTE
jgi:hypothetical protein